MPPTPAIELQSASRTYVDGTREVTALAETTLRIGTGSTVALVGRSGSGKSTLLHLVGGLEWPTTGQVRVAGQALQALGDAALTRFRLERIGFVFQFFHLLPALTVWENLLLPCELAGVPTAEATERAGALLEAVGLAERAGSFPDRLSGGEQQRVAVARALVLDPPILLADEPTGNLDAASGEQVLALMWRLTEARGTTLVVATHSPELAGRCERVIELRSGQILADSAVEAVPEAS